MDGVRRKGKYKGREGEREGEERKEKRERWVERECHSLPPFPLPLTIDILL